MVKPRQGANAEYVSTPAIYIKRHVSNIIVLVPAEEIEENSVGSENSGFRTGV